MKKDLELYIHIPFCVKKCAYCDFLSGPSNMEKKRAYFDALVREIRNSGDFSRYRVVSVFFGGGTPSSVPGAWITEIMKEIKQHFFLIEDPEISIEVNPGTIDIEKLYEYRLAGINRISFGCQSADNKELKKLGRIHTWEEFLESYHLARSFGFDNINVDLMSGLPDQTAETWENTLEKVTALSPDHISAYSLIIEEGAPFYELVETLNLPDEDEERLMYEQTAKLLQEKGYEQYEISNYSRTGKACQHNIGYWIGREYLGLGLGASSLIDHQRFQNTEDFDEYQKNSHRKEVIRQNIQILTKDNQMEEFMILGLRMNCGVSEEEFRRRFGCSIDEIYGTVLKKYTDSGHLYREDGRIHFTVGGISVSNIILSEMLL